MKFDALYPASHAPDPHQLGIDRKHQPDVMIRKTKVHDDYVSTRRRWRKLGTGNRLSRGQKRPLWRGMLTKAGADRRDFSKSTTAWLKSTLRQCYRDQWLLPAGKKPRPSRTKNTNTIRILQNANQGLRCADYG